MRVGVSTCFFNKVVLEEDDFAMLAEAGVRNLELCVNQEYLPQYADVCKQYGIAFSHRHAMFKYDISTIDEPKRATYTEMITDDIRRFAGFASDEKIVVVHASGVFEEADRSAHYAQALKSISAIATFARELGICVAVENAPLDCYMLASSPEELLQIISDVGTDNIGACIDVGHANITNNIYEYLEVLGDKIITFHLDDNSSKPEGSYWSLPRRSFLLDKDDGISEEVDWFLVDRHDLPGTGTIDWGKIGQAIRNIGFDGTLIFEIEAVRHKGNPRRGLKTIKRYFDKYLAEIT